MSDFGNSGIPGMPVLTLDSLQHGDPRVLGWIREAVQEGDSINRSDPVYDNMQRGMEYVAGMQAIPGTGASGGPSYLPAVRVNESRRVIQAHVSALTDLQPVFAYKATNPAFALQADLLNKLTIASWITGMMDLTLGDCIKYALCAGTGDLVTSWNPVRDDVQIEARDPRDTLPIRPSLHGRSIQSWEGVVLREGHSVNAMRGLFPDRANLFRPTTDTLLSTLMGQFRRMVNRMQSPAADTLSGLNLPAAANRYRSGDILLYRVFLNDRSRNLTSKPIPMGQPGSGWAYVVPPKGLLYPFKRMILCTPEAILYDGPSTYWHGQFPVSRLKLWDLPWHFLGIPLLNDLLPIQDAINGNLQDAMLAIQKWLNPAVAYNRRAVSENTMRLADMRRPGNKFKLTDEGMKEGFKQLEGPPPELIKLTLDLVAQLTQKFDQLSGTPNMQELLALGQLPGADTIQTYWKAVTPEIRQEGRQMEAFLRDVAEQLKVIRFQFESNAKRVTILGDAGQALADFDFDPQNLVPSMAPEDPGYDPKFDRDLPRDQRAQAFHKTIIFTIAPNSLLAMNSTESKMLSLQLSREGMMDMWTLMEKLEIPNVGSPPPMPLPPLNPEQAQADAAAMLSDPSGLGRIEFQKKYVLDPMSGLLEIRVPVTITERLQAQAMLGLGVQASPAGRPPSGGAPPALEQKSDGRTTVTESRHEAGNGPES